MLFEVNIMLDWKRKQSEESKKYVCFKKTMYQTVIGERQDKKEGRRGRSDGHGWTGWSVFNKSAQVVVISGPRGVQHFLKQRVWGRAGNQIHLLPVVLVVMLLALLPPRADTQPQAVVAVDVLIE